MNSWKPRDAILAGIGLISLLVYVLACASFSPDDTKVLFPSIDAKTQHLAVGLHDRETGTTEQLFTFAPGDEKTAFWAQWTADGRKAVVVWPAQPEGKRLNVIVLPRQTKEPTRLFTLPEQDEDDLLGSLVTAPPIVGRYLFLGSSGILRLDLETGAIRTNVLKGEVRLLTQNGRLFYMRDPDEPDLALEVGRLDPDTLLPTPTLQLRKPDASDFEGFLAISPDGSRFALPRKQEALLIYRDNKLEKTIRLPANNERLQLGNMQWSPDGKTIYAAYGYQVQDAATSQCGIIEIPVDGSAPRRIPLFPIADSADDTMVFWQIALSHDGKTMATANTFLGINDPDDIKPADFALYLVDLSAADRKVTKIQIPFPSAAKPVVGKR